MRAGLLLGGIVGVFTTVLPGQAQSPPDVRTITLREVQVRSGPNDKFYPTSKLVYGDKVEVVTGPAGSQQPGWLAIKPPRGSFSWINKRFVQESDKDTKIGIVVTDENTPVPVLVGSSETKEQPSKEGTRAKRGSQVILLGTPNYTDNGVWLPIQPQPGEVRYIPESAVQPSTLAPPMASGYINPTAPRTSGAPGTPVVAPVTAAGAADPNEDLRRILQQRASAETDPARRQKILDLLASLPAPSAGVQLPGHPGNVVATANIGGPGAAGTMSLYATANGAAAQPSITGTAAHWTDFYGELRRTAFRETDGRQVYALVDAQGRSRMYAVALPNFSLDTYVGRRVALYGPVAYHQDDPCLRADIMTVSHVAPLPSQNPY
jgi:hypothetical protein